MLVDIKNSISYAPLMPATINEIRRNNLLEMAKGYERDVDFAEALGIATGYLSQLKMGGKPIGEGRNIGEKLARKLESNLGLERGRLDRQESDHKPNVIQLKKYSDTVKIDQLSAVAGMGALVSVDGDHDIKIRTIELTKQYLSSQLGAISNPGNLKLMAGIGDSMKGVFKSGDTLFVDTGVNRFITEAVYVFHFDDHVWVKRLARNGRGGFNILSSNKEYEPVTVSKGDSTLKIIGLVVGVLNLNKLV